MSDTISTTVLEFERRASSSFASAFVLSAGVILVTTGIAKVWSRLLFVVMASLTLLLFPTTTTAAADVAATAVVYDGTIDISVLGPDGNPNGAASMFVFRAEVAQQGYQISTIATSGLSCFDGVAGSDGVDSYLLQKSWPSWKDKAVNSGYKEDVQVTPGLFPTLAPPEMQLLWILLACQRCLTNEPIVLSHISYAPYDGLKMNVQYAENGSWPALVEVFSSGFELIEGKKYPLPHPFEKGYKLWEFSTEEARRGNRLFYPKRAIFYQYSVFADEKSAELRRIRRIQIATTNAMEVPFSEAGLLPVLSQDNLMATDYRYSANIPRPDMGAVGAIQYRLRDKKWLSRSNSVVNSSGVSLKIETETAAHAAKTPSRRYGVLVGFLIISSGFVLFLVSKRRKL